MEEKEKEKEKTENIKQGSGFVNLAIYTTFPAKNNYTLIDFSTDGHKWAVQLLKPNPQP